MGRTTKGRGEIEWQDQLLVLPYWLSSASSWDEICCNVSQYQAHSTMTRSVAGGTDDEFYGTGWFELEI